MVRMGRTSPPPFSPQTGSVWPSGIALDSSPAMSLTSHLNDRESPVRGFLHAMFPNTRGPLAECRRAMALPATIDRLPQTAPATAYGQLGMAIDYRIRYHFAELLSRDRWVEDEWDGTAPAEMWLEHIEDGEPIVWRVRGGRAERIEQHAELIASRAAAFVIRRDGPPDDLFWHSRVLGDLGVPGERKLARGCVAGFFDALDSAVRELYPHQRKLTAEEERTFAGFCLILAAFESVYRAGARAWPPPYLVGQRPPDTADELLALVPDAWVEDAAALGSAFAARYPEWRGAEAQLNPNFEGSRDVGGADADFIADACLWDIKTTKKASAQGQWLRQLLGYVLLDYEDEYRLERVGLILPRQDTRVSWPVSDLIAAMSDRTDLELRDLRDRFRAVCQGS